MDFLAGSNVTGATAERMERPWFAIEQDPTYVRASQFRFEHREPVPTAKQRRKAELLNDPAALSLFTQEEVDLIH